MNNKIVGFTVSDKAIDHSDVDIFESGLTLKSLKSGNFYVYIWGIGNLDKCFLNKKCFSLSFPLHSSMLDRNVKVALNNGTIKIENDWLGSIPVFYHQHTGVISTLINKVIESPKIDPEGFNNYLNFGFSVFEQTPIKDVKFMRFYSKLTVSSKGIDVENKKDLEIKSKKNLESDVVIQKIEGFIRQQEKKVHGQIIIPTSGGYDSRLLNSLVQDKSRIRDFSYGVSKNQEVSDEVVKAKKVAELLGIDWERIELRSFNKYYREWYLLYGPALHLHGMYHIEFYKKITKRIKGEASLLSGFFGDVWSGNVQVPVIKGINDLEKLGYTHDLRIDPKNSQLRVSNKLTKKFWSTNKSLLKNHNYRILTVIRLKIILISYLISLPDYFGIPGWTPFLNYDVVKNILSIKERDWHNREWLRDYFRKQGLSVEELNLEYDGDNCLEFEGLKESQIEKIDSSILIDIMKSNFLQLLEIKYRKLVLTAVKKRDPIHLRLKKVYYLTRKSPYSFMKWYTYITVLKSIEMTLKKEVK